MIGDRGDAEDQDEEIECIERPAEKTGDEGVALDRSKTAKIAEEAYRRLLR
jgi:hypothetical protein